MSTATPYRGLRVETNTRQIMKIALPISFAMLVPQINFITNNIFLGGLGEKELGTAGLTGVYYLIFSAIGYGLNNGLQALIARRAGENRVEEIGKLFAQGIRISLVIAVIGILLTYFVAPALLGSFIHEKNVYAQTVSFLKIRVWGLPFLFVYQMRNALLVGTNQSKYLIAGTVAETVTNIFFDYTLIYGHWGFPELGFNGAAFASIIAEFTGMTVVFLVIHFKGISSRFSLFRQFGFDAANTKLILGQSSPLVFQHAISIISWTFFYILVEHHGQRALAVSNTMRNIFGFFGVFTWSFAATSNTMVSNIIGQNRHDQVIGLINKIMKISLSLACVVALLLNLFPRVFLSIYGQGEMFIEEAIPVMHIVSCALVLMSVSTVWINSVTGTGNSAVSLIIEVVTIFLYCVYVYLVLEVFNLPITYGWLSEGVYWTSLFLGAFWYIRSGKWKHKVI